MFKFPSCTIGLGALRCISGTKGRLSGKLYSPASHWLSSKYQTRRISDEATITSDGVRLSEVESPKPSKESQSFKDCFDFPSPTSPASYRAGIEATILGFVDKGRDIGANLTFRGLDTGLSQDIQVVSMVLGNEDPTMEMHKFFRDINAYTPIAVSGVLENRPHRVRDLQSEDSSADSGRAPDSGKVLKWDLRLKSVQCLNKFPKNIIVSKDAMWAPSDRHLQMRFDKELKGRLTLRADVAKRARKVLEASQFTEIETPILFKSTPEGAREFIVPTRRAGFAYALPQSPQQYKQILMAGGVRNYFQFARCFRDEDSRADRQPEFTQLDLEMGFANGHDVMKIVERILRSMFSFLREYKVPRYIDGVRYPTYEALEQRYGGALGSRDQDSSTPFIRIPKHFARLTYQYAMKEFGSDKPDLRIPSSIRRINHIATQSFVSMITKLEDPVIEAAQFRLKGTPTENLAFVGRFMDNLSRFRLELSPGSTPGVFVFDRTKPLNGLSALGHEAADQLALMGDKHWAKLEHGDIIIVHARENVPFRGEGWTDLGKLRKKIYDSAVEKGLADRDIRFRFCWVTEFPLFTPDEGPDVAAGEGQGGAAGLKATHHPFTAPLTADDFALLESEPLQARADHYDLVLNGVEIGGGSRRIHVAEMQEYIMRDILKMPTSGVEQFSHLLDALRAGCPPHAGFALGFDRFMSLLCDVESVRDVIAFPKNVKGEDLLAKSPSAMTQGQMETYHLAPKGYSLPDPKTS
ncbi:tRNA synthetases class II-domain-containing protein [Xylariales sp. AK1849]|nr:tRNA synthetases class II-domain-containing protein [Xylariales sp. AK1849]